MPCPFAPLLAVLPGVPFIPYLLGKFIKSKETEKVGLFDAQLSLDNLSTFEYYLEKAPDFRKKQASYCGKSESEGSEFLVFNESDDTNLASKLAIILELESVYFAKLDNNTLKYSLSNIENVEALETKLSSIN